MKGSVIESLFGTGRSPRGCSGCVYLSAIEMNGWGDYKIANPKS